MGAGLSLEALLVEPGFGLAAVLLLADLLLLCFWLGMDGLLEETVLTLAGASLASGTGLPEASNVIN